MEFAFDLLVGNSGRVAVIWLGLIVLAVVALGGLALPNGVRRPRQISAWLADSAAQKRADMLGRAAEAQETVRYAEEIAVAARGAAATAERRREECQQAQAAVEQAWQAWQDADAALERARRAAAYATPGSESPADERDDRAQALRRAAQAAHRRGDLSDDQLLDALTHRNGWDPELHPVEQELVLARAAVSHRFAAYQKALDAEDAAWKAADVATAAIRTLRTEVTAAQALADAARQALPEAAREILDRAIRDKVVLSAVPIATVAAEAGDAAGLAGLGIGDDGSAVTQPVPAGAIETATTQPVLGVAREADATQVVRTQADATQVVRAQADATQVVKTRVPAQRVPGQDEVTQVVPAGAMAAEADATQVVPLPAAVETTQPVVTQEVRTGRSGRRELPSWAQPTAGRPRIAGAR
ncbi:hypothetical protein [Pseudosporangium ferrugineum]|uniref:Uncharacterized protein n=1 Tax=Pseudosporangium ferrugineum TaxID=439699 RepID=A0A2T0RMA4_9ACTN|nr:hypothetical protein [Pseudosporangium ferrugineum]PRY22324.1 hypothetical protein CLV70_11727 [Pseudosporangium ferrugineum]